MVDEVTEPDLAYLRHVLGFYDHVHPPQVLAHAALTHDVDAITMHEQAHEWLAERSTVGLFLSLLARMDKETGTLDTQRTWLQVILADEARYVQEGFASFVEYRATANRPLELFRAELATLPAAYHDGFETALAIETILAASTLPEYAAPDLEFIQHCCLLDICRFSMNLPLPNTDLLEIGRFVRANSPNRRWRTVLGTLVLDGSRRRQFVDRCKPMFDTWIQKLRAPRGELYDGVSLGDNIETVIRELFSELPYTEISDAWFVHGVKPNPETTAEFLLRELSAEVHLASDVPIRFEFDWSFEDVVRCLRAINDASDYGCYVCLRPAGDLTPREVSLDVDVTLPPATAAVIIHEAFISTAEDGRRLWQYAPEGVAATVPVEAIPLLLDAVQDDDCAVVVDVDLSSVVPFSTVLQWHHLKRPLFARTTPAGSVRALAAVLSDPIMEQGADVIQMDNWNHFDGAGSPQIKLVWTIPRMCHGCVAVLVLTTPAILHGFEAFRAVRPFPLAVRFLNEGQVSGRLVKDRSPLSAGWEIRASNVVIAPTNADVISAHLVSFGW